MFTHVQSFLIYVINNIIITDDQEKNNGIVWRNRLAKVHEIIGFFSITSSKSGKSTSSFSIVPIEYQDFWGAWNKLAA
jgi:heme-degrading monooxygenase HmoA